MSGLMKITVLLVGFLIVGCENGQLVFTGAERARVKADVFATAEKRHDLFVECMKLAANIKRNGDDDVSDIIDDCGSESMYMANHFAQGM